jgi:hypothetical protein
MQTRLFISLIVLEIGHVLLSSQVIDSFLGQEAQGLHTETYRVTDDDVKFMVVTEVWGWNADCLLLVRSDTRVTHCAMLGERHVWAALNTRTIISVGFQLLAKLVSSGGYADQISQSTQQYIVAQAQPRFV